MTRSLVRLGVLVAALAVAACGGSTPSKPELTDPTAILAAAAAEAAAAPGVHVDASVDGSLSLDLLGTGAANPFDLTGTTAAADISIPTGNARVTFEVADAIRGELRTVDGTAYLKTGLTGARYEILEMDSPIPADPVGTALDALLEVLDEPGLELVKEADVDCGGETCYRVTLALTMAQFADLGLDLPVDLPTGLDEASVDLTLDVTRDTNDLSSVQAVVNQPDGEALRLIATFSKWDDEVVVEAPPADQIAPPR
jgi:hypothetical protein